MIRLKSMKKGLFKFCFQVCLASIFLSLITRVSIAVADEIVVKRDILQMGSNFTLISKGAFRLRAGTYGDSRPSYSAGPIAISEKDEMLYIAGHSHHFSVGAYSINKNFGFGNIESLPIAENTHPFVKINPINQPQGNANRITGIETYGKQLFVMCDEFYDANKDNEEFLVVFEDNTNLTGTSQVGFFSLDSKSHAAGWMSEIPSPLSKELGSSYFAGSASNLPINGRLSIGPSFFTWSPFDVKNSKPLGSEILTHPLIDYSLNNPLAADAKNETGLNNLWTELSNAVYGFISPDLQYYIVLGYSGGHESGIGYKITQDNGNLCGGYCAIDYSDYYNYYWIYSVDDIKSSLKNDVKPFEIEPVEFGKLPLLDYRYQIIGADFSRRSNLVYLSIKDLDKTQNIYESQPLIWAFELVEN